jgi:hypothetical protein
MSYYPATPFVPQFLTDTGVPLSGGTITAYLADTTTPTNMFIDEIGTSAGPVITLNARGEPVVSGNTVAIWLDSTVTYKFVLKDASAVSKWTVNDVHDLGGRLRTDLAEDSDAQLGSALVGHYDPVAPTYLKTVSDMLNGAEVSALRFIPKTQWAAIRDGSSAVDVSDNLNEAFDAMATNGRGRLRLPYGNYLVSDSLVVAGNNISIDGEGWGTVITASGDFGNVLDVGDQAGTAALANFSLRNLQFSMSGVVTNGSQIHMDAVTSFIVENVRILNGHIGISLLGCDQGHFDNVYALFNSSNGGSTAGQKYLYIAPTANTGKGAHGGDLFFNNINLRGGSTNRAETGVHITAVDGAFFNNFHVGSTTGHNLLINPNTATKCTGILFGANTWFDLCSGINIQIAGQTPTLHGDFRFIGSKILGAGTGQHGVVLSNSDAEKIVFDGVEITDFDYHGIDIRSDFTGEITILNSTILDCADFGSGAANGINLIGDCTATIRGNTVRGANHAEGIGISGAKTNCTIDDNILDGNIAPMSALTGTNISQKNNRGYNPQGSTSISVGASPYTYTNTYGSNMEVFIQAGTVSGIAKNGSNISNMQSGSLILCPNESVTVTYSVAPSMRGFRL